ncbi:multiubiquitin domain-containing protein [Nocardioides sp. WS12]|uniref:multiubiquitin domain-containing protein n=1 Tax=Nocardioides sp. WS12 TaxID=2486272 RepID=UPI0015FA69A7|nr:multiubiquitin domain-containing protein [Nocardioides sp. WS12]
MTATAAEKHTDDNDNKGDNGHPTKTFTLIINTRKTDWDKEQISYKDLVQIRFPGKVLDETEEVTIAYTRGPKENREGSLTVGHSVYVKNQMTFDVYLTIRS